MSLEAGAKRSAARIDARTNDAFLVFMTSPLYTTAVNMGNELPKDGPLFKPPSFPSDKINRMTLARTERSENLVHALKTMLGGRGDG